MDTLRALPLEERRQVSGLNPERADIIIAGGAILETLLRELGLAEIQVSNRGLRDGLLVDYLLRSGYAHLIEDVSVRERSVLQLGRLCNFDEAHGRAVSRLAMDLIDSARAAKLHTLGDNERELLHYAALLHDIGMFLSYHNHHAHSYYFIRNADLLGFNQEEIAVMATTVFFHRRTLPRKKHPEFGALEEGAQATVRVLSVLLRLAESLDRSHSNLIRQAHLREIDKRTISLDITATGDAQLELWGVRNHREAFETVFGRKLIIEPVLDK
jgi:exopolyphosphatase/guanosine-5'-triphosphate,3'-diphosphate pyrophosphatase